MPINIKGKLVYGLPARVHNIIIIHTNGLTGKIHTIYCNRYNKIYSVTLATNHRQMHSPIPLGNHKSRDLRHYNNIVVVVVVVIAVRI